MKTQVHKKLCGKLEGLEFFRKPRKAVMPKKSQCITAERRVKCNISNTYPAGICINLLNECT